MPLMRGLVYRVFPSLSFFRGVKLGRRAAALLQTPGHGAGCDHHQSATGDQKAEGEHQAQHTAEERHLHAQQLAFDQQDQQQANGGFEASHLGGQQRGQRAGQQHRQRSEAP